MDNSEMNNINTIEPKQSKDVSKILSILSLILYCLFLGGLFTLVFVIQSLLRTPASDIVKYTVAQVVSIVFPFFPPASIVLMIIARVKNPKNTMAKVMMWIWIATVIILVILVIAALTLVASACESCLKVFSY